VGRIVVLLESQALLDLERLAAQGLDPASASWSFRQLALL